MYTTLELSTEYKRLLRPSCGVLCRQKPLLDPQITHPLAPFWAITDNLPVKFQLHNSICIIFQVSFSLRKYPLRFQRLEEPLEASCAERLYADYL